jgi:uncharacterized protein (TIGR02246 family)
MPLRGVSSLRERSMKRISSVFSLLAASLALLAANRASGGQTEDEAAIRKSAASYTEAFNKHDAKGLAAHWSPDAVYLNPISGEEAVGHDAIEKEFAAVLDQLKGAKLETKIDAVRFVSPNVAVENGKAIVTAAEGKPSESTYTAIYVKRDGKWLLDRVTEEDIPELVSQYERLKDLEWMVGSWVDADDRSEVETTCHWSKNKNFLVRSYSVSIGDRIDRSGMQLIGWDPVGKRIRSWMFESDGSFGEATWTKKENHWFIQAKDTLADGQQLSSENIVKVVDKDRFTWQSTNRQLGGVLLPNLDEVEVVRE